MYLQSIEIKSFGQLQNFNLHLQKANHLQKSEPMQKIEPVPKGERLQKVEPVQKNASCTQAEIVDLAKKTMLIWPNEAGKSTVLACIRALFYGLGNKRTKGLARRQQYLHFTGSKSSARLTFTHQGKSYELARNFGKTERTDEINLLNLTSGETIDLAGVEPGYYLFGITEEQFVNTLLVEQMSVTLPANSQSPEIVEALTNLGLTGNSTVNVQKAMDKIDKQLKELRFKRGQGGLIFAQTTRISQLQAEIKELDAKCQHFNDLQRLTNKLTCDLEKTQASLNFLNTQKKELLKQSQTLALLEREQTDLLEKQYQAKEANEVEYKAQMTKSFDLAAKVARLDNEIKTNKQSLELLSLQRKKTSQRQLANKTKLANWQKNLAQLKVEIQNENIKLAAGEKAIHECSTALLANSEQQAQLKQTLHELQSQKEKLTISTLQANSTLKQNKTLSYFAMLSIALVLLCIFNYVNEQLPVLLVVASFAFAAFLNGFYLVRRRKSPDLTKNKLELEQIALALASHEKELQACIQAEIDIKSKKFELVSQNKRNYLENLLTQQENSRRDIADLERELEQAELEINEQDKQRQAKQLLLSHEQAEFTQLKQKASEQTKLVAENEKFLENSKDILQKKSQDLQSKIAENTALICRAYNLEELDLVTLVNVLKTKLTELNTAIENVHARLNEQHIAASTAKVEAKAVSDSPIALAQAQMELAVCQAKLSAYEQSEANLQLAYKLLANLFVELQNDFSPKLRERCSFYLKSLSLGRYTDLTVDKTLHLQLRYEEDQAWHVAEYLSGAAYEQVYLALRLALCDLLASAKKLPLLLDDCLVQFDKEHQIAALRVLADFADTHNCQLLFFSCHSYLANILQEHNFKNWQVLTKYKRP